MEKVESTFAQLHRLKRLNRSNQPQKGMVIWRSVQRDILARNIYKRRHSKEDKQTPGMAGDFPFKQAIHKPFAFTQPYFVDVCLF